jgi:hypothetical protein
LNIETRAPANRGAASFSGSREILQQASRNDASYLSRTTGRKIVFPSFSATSKSTLFPAFISRSLALDSRKVFASES